MIYNVSMLKIGLIGLGTIGKALVKAIADGTAGQTGLSAVFVRPPSKAKAIEFLQFVGLEHVLVTDDFTAFLQTDISLVVEAAGQDAVRSYASTSLANGKDLLICAIGAFTDDALFSRLCELAQQNNKRLIIPSGALAGIDALAGAALAGIDAVVIATRKPPSAWYGTPAENMVNLAEITEHPVCLFNGSARDAARLFPSNVNVAATLAYAGIGLDRTTARIYADPTIARNVHQISIQGKCGEINIEVAGLPSPDNPRTSALTPYSIIKTIRNLTAHFIIG
jgi:aspartate dehydrogenase